MANLKGHQTKHQRYREKLAAKRARCPRFNIQFKKKRAAQQAKLRQQRVQPILGPSSPKVDLRRIEGQKRRRANTAALKTENKKLRETVRRLQREGGRRQSRSPPATPPKSKCSSISSPISPASLLVESLSPGARKRATRRLVEKKDEMPRGSISSIRKKFKINLSNTYHAAATTKFTLETQIEEFLCQDDVSKVCPDKKKVLNGRQIRYRLDHLIALHRRFESETLIDVDYVTFTRHVPDYIQKPKVDDWGTCLCISCLNPQLKWEKLQRGKSKWAALVSIGSLFPSDLSEVVMDHTKLHELRHSLANLANEQFDLTFCEWQKVKSPKSAASVSTKVTLTETSDVFLKKFHSELDFLELHLERVRAQYRAAKMARSEAMENDNTVCIQIDWSENYKLRQAKEEKGAFYHEQHVSIHAGYAWSKASCWSFASLSDNTCHMAEACWASFKELLEELIEEKKMKKITLISDSPLSQYRNKTTIFFLKKYATSRKIEMKWIFLKSGHGKGVPDGVGASLKRQMDDAIAFKPDVSFNKTFDLVVDLKVRTDIHLYIYDTNDVELIKKSMPVLKAVKGTATIHELIAMPDGKVFGKDKSNENSKLLKVPF